MEKIDYERNWCDYFTKCPYIYDEEMDEPYVGNYACARCVFHKGTIKELAPTDYAFVNTRGAVKCAYKDSDTYHMKVLMSEQKETAD